MFQNICIITKLKIIFDFILVDMNLRIFLNIILFSQHIYSIFNTFLFFKFVKFKSFLLFFTSLHNIWNRSKDELWEHKCRIGLINSKFSNNEILLVKYMHLENRGAFNFIKLRVIWQYRFNFDFTYFAGRLCCLLTHFVKNRLSLRELLFLTLAFIANLGII